MPAASTPSRGPLVATQDYLVESPVADVANLGATGFGVALLDRWAGLIEKAGGRKPIAKIGRGAMGGRREGFGPRMIAPVPERA